MLPHLLNWFFSIFKGFVAVGIQAWADWVSKLARESVKISDDRFFTVFSPFFHLPLPGHRALPKCPNGQSVPDYIRNASAVVTITNTTIIIFNTTQSRN